MCSFAPHATDGREVDKRLRMPAPLRRPLVQCFLREVSSRKQPIEI
jgi:hypothetical protein